MAKTVKLALAVEGTAFTKQGKERSHKSPVKKQQDPVEHQTTLGKRQRLDNFKNVMQENDSDSD